MRLKIGVLASGRGTDFQAIIDAVEGGKCAAEIKVLISDRKDVNALERAAKHKIPAVVMEPAAYGTRVEHDEAVLEELRRRGVELVVLAGYMRLIKSAKFLKEFEWRIINIHPSLLPKFPGAHAQRDAFKAGAKVSGYTVHFVDGSLDGGPIIWQESVRIDECENEQEVSDKILVHEHVGLPLIVDSFSKGHYQVEGKKVRFVRFG